MKQVFNNSEVPHIWAQQSQPAGRNSNGSIYFEGATIYSYGRHFPMATIEGNDVFLTKKTYSNSTAKHLSKTWRAVSHKNIIHCFDVPLKHNANKPLNKQELFTTHESNIATWKKRIVNLFDELGNKRNRDKTGRINAIASNVNELTIYTSYFGIKIKDKELSLLIEQSQSPDFIEIAQKERETKDVANAKKMEQAAKAYEVYLKYWREFNENALLHLPTKTKELCNFYHKSTAALTRLRFNKEHNRVETSKGVQIPAEIAKRAFIQLNGCMEGTCDSISVPVMNYTITKTTKDTVVAGCHTIPKSDIRYIADLLNW